MQQKIDIYNYKCDTEEAQRLYDSLPNEQKRYFVQMKEDKKSARERANYIMEDMGMDGATVQEMEMTAKFILSDIEEIKRTVADMQAEERAKEELL